MEVSAWKGGGSTYGIRVGAENRERFFERSWTTIDVEIGSRVHTINLTPGFWDHCPEFRDPVIREWLHRRGLIPWPRGNPPRFNLDPIGNGRFRLDVTGSI